MKKIFAILLTLVLVAGVFAACGAGTEETTVAGETTTGEKLTATDGVLVMATNAAFPPYEFKEGDDFAGIDVEIAGKIAEKLGLTLEIKDVEFGSIVGGVQTGKFDMGMAGMTVTDERLESVNFSTSYATGIQVVIVAEGSAIKSLDDLKGDGSMKFGVQQDTTGDIYASDTAENGGYGEENVVRYKTGADAVQALKTGKVDAVIIDNEPAKSFVAANEGLTILDGEWTLENYAIAIAKENTALLTAVNNALAELTADGTVASIVAKYIPASEETTEAADETTEAAAEETTEAAAEETTEAAA
ncbi:MAG: transporter substrate-binding domain-containing protein [Clostridia bacterium]|nr:transporter substrate-binding domain-containing protein [Clostridia bacterium]